MGTVIAVTVDEQFALETKQKQARIWLEANPIANAMNVKWRRYFKHSARPINLERERVIREVTET